jgi:hypothetical protein
MHKKVYNKHLVVSGFFFCVFFLHQLLVGCGISDGELHI